ncbi:MAG: NAD(P)H-dependent oxidoreductase [Bacteroidetes bacterium]|nr:NAD(P)H-dependent oxidoreductase [Bacteroidota bacterium]
MFILKIIIASTRPGRKGPHIAEWVYDVVKKNEAFETELIDLAAINLPFLDEPHHPRLKKYEQQHTKDWSAKIDPADAFIIVTPEYNFGYPATLKNALDFLYQEWNYKPVGIVSYGGISAGLRAAQMLRQVFASLKLIPLAESVSIPFFAKHINEQGKFITDETLDHNLTTMINELIKWSEAMKAIREKR